ncbi:hypothetical protein Taro_016866, partial [Colocasia esculenta]|nr:hypothetical protein [Colocasia esculenta]
MMEKVSRNDIFSQVMGEDGHSWVRIVGMGPTPSKVFGDKSSHVTVIDRVSTSDEEVQKMREEMKVLQTTVQSLGHCLVRVLQNGGGSTNNINVNGMLGALNLPMPNTQDLNSSNNILDIGSPHDNSSSRVSNVGRNHESPSLFISRGKDPQASNEKIVKEVFLKSWNEADFVIASGIIISRDSKKKVGGVELGDFFCEVSIEIPIQPLAPLIRPYCELKTIGDAVMPRRGISEHEAVA